MSGLGLNQIGILTEALGFTFQKTWAGGAPVRRPVLCEGGEWIVCLACEKPCWALQE
jgi:hypothetical protein